MKQQKAICHYFPWCSVTAVSLKNFYTQFVPFFMLFLQVSSVLVALCDSYKRRQNWVISISVFWTTSEKTCTMWHDSDFLIIFSRPHCQCHDIFEARTASETMYVSPLLPFPFSSTNKSITNTKTSIEFRNIHAPLWLVIITQFSTLN